MMTHARLMTAMVLAGSMMAVGCGSDDDPVIPGPTYTYPDLGAFCAARAKAECSDEVISRCATDTNTCVAARQGACGASKPAGANYRPQAADGCVDAAKAAHLDDEITSVEAKNVAEACAEVFGGVGTKGTSCQADVKCSLDNDLRCVIRSGQTEGTCQVPDEKGPADDCSALDAVCDDTTYCQSGSDPVCAKKKTAGAACSGVMLCQDDLRCVPTDDEGAGTCQSKLATSEACNPEQPDECSSGLCATFTTASGVSSRCANSIILAPSEPACDAYR